MTDSANLRSSSVKSLSWSCGPQIVDQGEALGEILLDGRQLIVAPAIAGQWLLEVCGSRETAPNRSLDLLVLGALAGLRSEDIRAFSAAIAGAFRELGGSRTISPFFSPFPARPRVHLFVGEHGFASSSLRISSINSSRESCSRRIACCSWGVMTSCWLSLSCCFISIDVSGVHYFSGRYGTPRSLEVTPPASPRSPFGWPRVSVARICVEFTAGALLGLHEPRERPSQGCR